MTRKDIRLLAICVGAVALALLAVHFLWPSAEPDSLIRTSEYCSYVASVNSEVFHKPDCRYVKQIKQENLVGFTSEKGAVNSGRRACKVCKP